MKIHVRLGPFSASGDLSAGARPASRRSNRAAGIVLLVIVISLALCAGAGALLGGPPRG